MQTLFLMVGLPGSGKTTKAREFEVTRDAIRFSPDEWMAPLFGASDLDGKRDVLEGRLIWTATQILRARRNATLDFGLWGRDERASLHWLASRLGARAETVYLPIDPETQLERVASRWNEQPLNTWPMSADVLAGWRSAFDVPDADELEGVFHESSRPGHRDWLTWIADRWPTAL